MGISYKVGAKQNYDVKRSEKAIFTRNEKNFTDNESVMVLSIKV